MHAALQAAMCTAKCVAIRIAMHAAPRGVPRCVLAPESVETGRKPTPLPESFRETNKCCRGIVDARALTRNMSGTMLCVEKDFGALGSDLTPGAERPEDPHV